MRGRDVYHNNTTHTIFMFPSVLSSVVRVVPRTVHETFNEVILSKVQELDLDTPSLDWPEHVWWNQSDETLTDKSHITNSDYQYSTDSVVCEDLLVNLILTPGRLKTVSWLSWKMLTHQHVGFSYDIDGYWIDLTVYWASIQPSVRIEFVLFRVRLNLNRSSDRLSYNNIWVSQRGKCFKTNNLWRLSVHFRREVEQLKINTCMRTWNKLFNIQNSFWSSSCLLYHMPSNTQKLVLPLFMWRKSDIMANTQYMNIDEMRLSFTLHIHTWNKLFNIQSSFEKFCQNPER